MEQSSTLTKQQKEILTVSFDTSFTCTYQKILEEFSFVIGDGEHDWAVSVAVSQVYQKHFGGSTRLSISQRVLTTPSCAALLYKSSATNPNKFK